MGGIGPVIGGIREVTGVTVVDIEGRFDALSAPKTKTELHELIEGGGGIFDIRVDSKLIYSKHQTGRFPEHDEILTQLEALKT